MFYIIGIMFYKFGLEAFNGSIVTLATDRFNAANTFTKLGALTGLNQAMQCVGAILIAPLVKRFRTRTVLGVAIICFGVMTTLLLIIDAATGGRVKRSTDKTPVYGTYNPNGIFPIYMITGIFYGMVELIRRVIPRDIVGGNVQKLRKMDATVHVLYEVAGTGGAFASTALIIRFGNNYSFCITAPFFTIAAVAWWFIQLDFEKAQGQLMEDRPTYVKAVVAGAALFAMSIYKGAKLVFTRRKLVWLWGSYAVALYAHRYLENAIAPAIARRVFQVSAYSQIMVGGSNLGELLGAFCVFLFSNWIKTPLPWIRWDAIMLLLVWYLPFYKSQPRKVVYAWRLAAYFMPISFGWAAGDVSLAAYIQAILAREEGNDPNISALGAVMSFLYSSYIVLYAFLSVLLGRVIDRCFREDGNIKRALIYVAGIHFTCIAVFVFANTFIPKGAFGINPDMLYNENLEREVDEVDEKAPGSPDNNGTTKGQKDDAADFAIM